MRRFSIPTLALMALLWGRCSGPITTVAAERSDEAMLTADHAFVAAAAKADRRTLETLLDADFTWTDANGKTQTRAQVLQSHPQPGISGEAGAQRKEYVYGEIGDVQVSLGKLHALRVWVKRPAGWRAIVYQEVASLAASPSFAPGAGKNCENPCKSISYEPNNETEKQVVSAYERLETAAMAHNSAAFSTLVADEFVAASSNSNKVYDKRGRMEDFDHAKMAGVAPTPLSSARMYDFGGVVLMTSLHRPDHGKPLHVTRIWIERNGEWVEALSYQTSIQSAP